ncbi:MAG: TolC family protein [Sedimentisphaerales bacterium]|nr:TolC family protein [Sedimentisphaerales bacterium]
MLKFRLLVLVLFAGVLVCGCVSQEEVGRGFAQNRAVSYNRMVAVDGGDPNLAGELLVVSGDLSLARAMELAQEYNQSLAVQRARLLEAEGQMVEAISTAMPKVDLTSNALWNDNEVINVRDSYQWQLLARQPLYLGGLSGAVIDAAAVFSYMVGQETRGVEQQVELQVRTLYLATLLAAELEGVSRQARVDASENLRLVEARYNQGEALRFELLRSRVRLRAIEAEIIQMHNEYLVSLAALLNEIGVSQLSDVTLTDELVYSEVAVDEGGCLRWAMLRRPDLLIGESLVRLARDNIAVEQSGDRPKVYFQAMYQEDRPGVGVGSSRHWERTANAGLVLEWSVFNGRQTEGRVTQARAELHRQQSSLRQLEQQVQLETTQSLLTLESAKEFVESQRGNVADAEESLRLARVNFREGANTSLDVITEELQLATARSDYIQAVHGYQLAQLQLAAAVGVLGEMELTAIGTEDIE